MAKILVLLIIAIAAAAGAIASRNVRSPGGSGWLGSNSFGEQPTFGGGRSSVTSWSSFGSGPGRSTTGNGARGGWRGARFGSGSHDLPENGNPSSYANRVDGSWSSFSGSATGWSNGGTARSTNVNGAPGNPDFGRWDKSRQDFSANNGWQSLAWHNNYK